MNKIDKCKAARDYHTHGCNCAQSILAAFHQEMGLTEDQCMALAGGMGGGMRCGSICGAISGGILVLGMLFPARPDEGPAAKRRITRTATAPTCLNAKIWCPPRRPKPWA